MNKKITVSPDSIKKEFDGLPGSILNLALNAGIDMDHSCGGVCACSTCHIIVKQGIGSCNEANEDEEDMLTSKLEQDEQLSMLFDKVLEVASEFAGSGPVEGPGSGVSDSIPARLSDGEFVFTAKATEEIGADELMRMMKDAEANADKRQQMANGGEPEEETMTRQTNEPNVQEIRVVKETVDSAGRMMEDEDEISKDIKSQMMLDPNQRHVRS